jgi:general secretion pathway protein H
MQMLAVGSNTAYPSPRGFTLLELLVVMAIIALATAGVSLALRDPEATTLEREADRLAAILEAGRSQSRTTGLPVRWQSDAQGYVLLTPSGNEEKPLGQPTLWLDRNIAATSSKPVLLGPEPIITAQSISLRLQDRTLVVSTDGLRPFALQTDASSP